MSYFWTCRHCGANLDSGEKCNCLEEKEKKLAKIMSYLIPDDTGQMRMILNNKSIRAN